MRIAPGLLLLGAGLLACAEASAPLPPPEEVLLVVNQGPAALTVIPLDNPTSSTTIPLGAAGNTPVGVSASAGWAIVPLGSGDAAAVVDLGQLAVARTVMLGAGSGATGSTIVDDSIAYVANPGLNTVTRINYLTGDTASVTVGPEPRGVVFTRGKVFVLNSTGMPPTGASWVSVVDPLTNRLATGVDSILMPGPGGARFADVARDGVMYVMNAGPDDGTTAGRLSLIDPVGRSELGSFGGFGTAPGAVASDAVDRLYISSTADGLMVFDLIARQVLRGAGNGVGVPDNSGVAVDASRRVYALEQGACDGSASARAHILRHNLTEIRAVPAGTCAQGALITEIPPS